jgi:hypothetical protein
MKKATRKTVTAAAIALLLGTSQLVADEYNGELRWWKGNTHTHSWWSDGDAPPEVIADWYKSNGYDFLVLSDHNIMQQGEKWYPIDEPPRKPEQVREAYESYVAQFGADWVHERRVDGKLEVRLKTLDDFRSLFEEANEFIFIKGEEITDRFEAHPMHMNGVNLVELILPQGGTSVADTIQNNLNAVVAQQEKYQQPMVAHLNHPNFHYAQTAEDFFQLDHKPGDGFFEMYNGHSGVDNHGDELHISTERMWDIVLSKRLGEYDRSVIYGVATDDAHDHMAWGEGMTNPGRGWMMVRSTHLTPNAITAAVKRGDFYNSTGVTLRSLTITDDHIELEIEPQDNAEYRIEFIGTRQEAELAPIEKFSEPHEHRGNLDHNHQTIHRYSDEIGEVLESVEGTHATYQVRGDELYVRARITSTRRHVNPFAVGDLEMAWTQPLVVKVNDSQR